MRFDDRLRAALRHEAQDVDPDVESGLERVLERRGRRSGRPGGLLLAAATAVVVLLVLVQVVPDRDLSVVGPASTPAATPTPPSSPSLEGSYRSTLDGAHAEISSLGLAGEWTMELRADGALELTPPPEYRAGGAATLAAAFALVAGSFETNLLSRGRGAPCTGSGSYAWDTAGGVLTFRVLADTCVARRTLLTASAWSRTDS
jgi:hypothetical protein